MENDLFANKVKVRNKGVKMGNTNEKTKVSV